MSSPGILFSRDDPTFQTLLITLQLAVPMWIDRYKTWDARALQDRATACADQVACHGDALMFKGKTKAAKKSAADTFNALAEGLGVLAYSPGGVTFGGLHWCVGSRHGGITHDGGPCDAEIAREQQERDAGPSDDDDQPPRVVTRPTTGDVL